MADGGTSRGQCHYFGAHHRDQMNYPPLRATSMLAPVRRVLRHRSETLDSDTRWRILPTHLAAGAEECPRATRNREISRCGFRRRSGRRGRTAESAGHNVPDWGAVGRQYLEG